MFQALKKFLFAPAEHHHDGDQLRPLDIEAVAEELDVYQSGASDGRNEIPKSDATNPSVAEVRIIGFFQDEAQAASKFFRDKILDLQKFLKQKSLAKYENRLSSILPTFKAEIDSEVAQSKPNLVQQKQRENELHDEYRNFRRQNRLNRSADYPENKFFLISIIVGILLIEAILNGYFFAQANEFGLVGGVSQATVTAGINIAIGWLFGRFIITQMNHCSKARRYTAVALVPIALLCFIIFYNLFIGHFRDELATTVATNSIEYGAVSKDVLQSILSNPLGLRSFDSWLLVFLGIVFAFIATADGYNFNDPYPGYGRVAKRFDVARRDYSEDKQDFLDDLADLREETAGAVESIKFDIESQSRSINDIITATKKRESEYEGYMLDLGNKCNHVLQLYRTSNRQARKTDDPMYFAESFELSKDIHSPPVEVFDLRNLQEQLSNVDGLLQNVTDVSLSIEKTYSRAIGKIGKELEEIES